MRGWRGEHLSQGCFELSLGSALICEGWVSGHHGAGVRVLLAVAEAGYVRGLPYAVETAGGCGGRVRGRMLVLQSQKAWRRGLCLGSREGTGLLFARLW